MSFSRIDAHAYSTGEFPIQMEQQMSKWPSFLGLSWILDSFPLVVEVPGIGCHALALMLFHFDMKLPTEMKPENVDMTLVHGLAVWKKNIICTRFPFLIIHWWWLLASWDLSEDGTLHKPLWWKLMQQCHAVCLLHPSFSTRTPELDIFPTHARQWDIYIYVCPNEENLAYKVKKMRKEVVKPEFKILSLSELIWAIFKIS